MAQDDAAAAAFAAYKEAIANGAANDTAVAVAVARFRATYPTATEFEVRSSLAHAIAKERLAADRTDAAAAEALLY